MSSTANGGKQRYDNQSHIDSRYQDTRQSSSGGGWFGNSSSGGGGGTGGQSKSYMASSGGQTSSTSWPLKQQQPDWARSNMDSNQDRYDRTYNERRAPQFSDSQRSNSFVGRAQERSYGGGGRF